MSSATLAECHGCGQRKKLVHITAEDIMRTRPPLITMVCAECRETYRAAALLKTSYPTSTAFRELGVMILAGFSLLLLFSNLISNLSISLPITPSQIVFLVAAVTSLTGLQMTYFALGNRYGFTHNLAWSLHSRYAMISISLMVSGILVTAFHVFIS